jgi:hypothetical protein
MLQADAAAWIASQVSTGAMVACDPVMCAALQAHGVIAGGLVPLGPGSADQGSANVMVTSRPADRQLAVEYAPAVIASFGAGPARIEVRLVTPGGVGAYESALRADLAARMNAGSQLLQNLRIQFTAQDAARLRAGEVDSRLLGHARGAVAGVLLPGDGVRRRIPRRSGAVPGRDYRDARPRGRGIRACGGSRPGEHAGAAVFASSRHGYRSGRRPVRTAYRVLRAEPAGPPDDGPDRILQRVAAPSRHRWRIHLWQF